jgi:hypothetical protein
MNGKSHSFSLMTDITHSHLTFMNDFKRDFQAIRVLVNFSYRPIMSHPILAICSQMAISLMFASK